MPEGHTIHALAGRIDRSFGGRPVSASSPQGRFSDEAGRLDGEVVEGARAVGKHLFVVFPDETLHIHLGLIGSFPVKPLVGQQPVEPRGALRLRLLNDDFVADLRGPITCELLGDDEVARVEAGLGPDPLDPKADGERAWDRIRLRRKTIAELLMDQSVLAGVGNVYRCEVLHRHRTNPFTLGTQLKRATWQLIWADLVRLLPLGVAFSQILTVEDQVEEAESMMQDGSASPITAASTGERVGGHFERRYAVYKRTGQMCPRCGKTV
ncbi:MAG: DNA-formamidopyrimidine glycosylase family protein, partial [Humibacillus sp.]